MIIIIEGPDGAGKSTLAQKLSSQLGFPIVHRSNPKTDKEKKRMFAMYKQAIEEGTNVIFDRCWYSEMVYGPIMRDEHIMSIKEMYDLEQLMLCNGGGLIIYCSSRSAHTLWDRCQARGEDYVTQQSTFVKIFRAYDTLMRDIPHYIPVVLNGDFD